MSNFANQVLLAKKWDEGTDPTGWWMSEKVCPSFCQFSLKI